MSLFHLIYASKMDVMEGGVCTAGMNCESGCCIKGICAAEYAACPRHYEKCSKDANNGDFQGTIGIRKCWKELHMGDYDEKGSQQDFNIADTKDLDPETQEDEDKMFEPTNNLGWSTTPPQKPSAE